MEQARIMAAFSKALPYTCYEIGHTWHPDCSAAILDVLISSMIGSMKIYAVVYALTTLISRKKLTLQSAKNVLKNYIRSVCFLTVNGFGFVFFVCIYRKILQHTNLFSASFLPAFTGSAFAIFVERESRRNVLTTYVANVASECLWNVGVGRNVVKPRKYGEVLVFSVATTILGYYLKSKKPLSPLLVSICKFFVGTEETENVELAGKKGLFQKRQESCSQKYRCLTYIVKSMAIGYAKGYGVRVTIQLVSSFRKLLRNPSFIKTILFGSSVNAGLFLALFNGIYKGTLCLGNWINGQSHPFHGAIAGALAGSSMLLFPSSAIALHVFWKSLETMCEDLTRGGYIPQLPYGREIMYSLCTAYLFHVAICERQFMKPSYWRFLVDLTDNRVSQYNRKLLDVYGLDSSKSHSWPKYRDISRLTPEFMAEFGQHVNGY